MQSFILRCATGLAFSLCLLQAIPARAAGEADISVICIEADRGLVLFEENAGIKRPPASMIKLMLMLLVTEGYERGDWTPDMPIAVTAHAESMGGTQVYLKEGETWPLEHLMHAVAVASANDASMAVAEGLWGSEAAYLKVANARAAELGMKDTVIHGVHGLPPDNGKDFDMTTARDMAILSLACIKKPEIMALVGQKELQFRPEDATKHNTNKLLWRMQDCDGLKTGYINAAGFCISATAQRHGRRLVCVVMGSNSKYGRFQLAQDTFDRFLDDYSEVRLLGRGAPLGVEVPVSNGRAPVASVSPAGDVSVLLPRQLISQVEVSAIHPETLVAPIRPMAVVGELTVSLHDKTIATVPLMVPEGVEAEGWYLSIRDGIARWNGLEKMNAAAGSSEREGETAE